MALRSELNFISLCTGGGGLDFGVELAIPCARPIVLVEREAFAVARLAAAMEEKLMAQAPVWSDVRTFNGRRFRGYVDGLIGGIPCQPHSVAGKQLGSEDERDLWADTRRIIVQARTWFVLIENVQGMLSTGGAERVWRDLQRLGFDVEVGLFTSAEVGAPHERKRVFILAVADTDGRHTPGRIAGRGETIGGRAYAEPSRSSEEFSDAERDSNKRRGDARDFSCEKKISESGARERQRRGNTADDRRADVGDSDCARLEGRDGRSLRERAGEQIVGETSGTVADAIGRGHDGITQVALRQTVKRTSSERSERNVLPLYPPGPDNICAWSRIDVDRFPALSKYDRFVIALRNAGIDPPRHQSGKAWRAPRVHAPVVSKAAKSHLRRMDDGMARRLDQLRMLGNGVNPLQAAYAIRTLATRLARRSAAANELVRMMGIG